MIDLEKTASISYDDLQQWIADNSLSNGSIEETKDVLIYMGYLWFHMLKTKREALTLDLIDRGIFGDEDIDDLAPITFNPEKLN